MKKMFPKYSKNIITSRARNVFDIAVKLYNKGHKELSWLLVLIELKSFQH